MSDMGLVIDYSQACIATDDLAQWGETLEKEANAVRTNILESLEPTVSADEALGKLLADLMYKARSHTFGCVEVGYRLQEISEAMKKSADKLHKRVGG